MATFWVSFATDEEFLGVAIVDVDVETASGNTEEIVRETIRLGCNPGHGSVQIQKIPDSEIPSSFKNRLLDKDEAGRLMHADYLNS